uniref:L-lactate dehydrogenase n=1 Tax=Trachymyrmex cornetzi TaxID=471704 RepID=A0A151K385_9HYME
MKTTQNSKNYNNKVVVIGGGFVGSAIFHDLIVNRYFNEYGLIDINEKLAQGVVADLDDGYGKNNFSSNLTIKVSDYKDVGNANIVVITAGRNQRPGETRTELLKDNVKILTAIIENINKSGFNGIMIIVSNPNDVMTHIARKISNLPGEQIFGSGTVLDSFRAKQMIIGEHGDTSLLLKNIGKDTEAVEKQVRNRAYEIIQNKGNTCYGIAAAVSYIIKTILSDKNENNNVLPLSVKYDDISISVPVVLDIKNDKISIKTQLLNDMDKTQKNKFNHSCETVKTNIKSLEN